MDEVFSEDEYIKLIEYFHSDAFNLSDDIVEKLKEKYDSDFVDSNRSFLINEGISFMKANLIYKNKDEIRQFIRMLYIRLDCELEHRLKKQRHSEN